MISLSKRVREISPSATIKLTARVNKLKEEGTEIITLNVGEPDLGTPENICGAGISAIRAQKTRYTTVSGVRELKQAICAKLLRDNGLSYTEDEVSVQTGAKQSLLNAVLAVVDEGDEVIIPTPCWVSYIEMVKLAGGIPVRVECREEDDFAPDMEAIEKAVTSRTRAVIINTPNNPTGAVYDRKSLERLARIAEEHDLVIISDEAYEKLVYDGRKHISVASVSDDARSRTILINGMSKAYAMTGWRVGYTAAPKEIIRAVNAIQGHATTNCCTVSQYAAIEALNGPQESVEMMREEYDRRRTYVYNRLCAMKGITCSKGHGAFYLLPNVSFFYGRSFGGKTVNDSLQLADLLLEDGHIALVPGAAFEAPCHLRVSYSNSMANLEKAMDRMEETLLKIN